MVRSVVGLLLPILGALILPGELRANDDRKNPSKKRSFVRIGRPVGDGERKTIPIYTSHPAIVVVRHTPFFRREVSCRGDLLETVDYLPAYAQVQFSSFKVKGHRRPHVRKLGRLAYWVKAPGRGFFVHLRMTPGETRFDTDAGRYVSKAHVYITVKPSKKFGKFFD